MHEPSTSKQGKDLIYIKALNLKSVIGLDSWQRPKPQPILLSLWLKTSVALAGSTDHLPYSIHYGLVCKAVTKVVESGTFNSLRHLAEEVASLVLGTKEGAEGDSLHGEWVQIIVEKPRALLRADAAGITIVRTKDGKREVEDRVFVKDLRLVTIVGVNPWERKEKQNVILNFTLHKPIPKNKGHGSKGRSGEQHTHEQEEFDPHLNFRKVAQTIAEHVEESKYKTVEALVTSIARVACLSCGVEKITVSAEKPSALAFAECAGVEVTRQKKFFEGHVLLEVEKKDEAIPTVHTAFLALGSNVGDRFRMICEALKELDSRGVKVIRTSSLYETKPMYVTEQPEFLNGVCQVETSLSPEDLLKEIKDIENRLGRQKTTEKGPRCIDLDILLYDRLTMSTESLTIPHKLMLEREFVLRPLCDIASELHHPLTATSFRTHLASLPPSITAHQGSIIRIYVPLSPSLPSLDPINPTKSTLLMAVLNLTPDSFSDGGKYGDGDPEKILSVVQKLIEFGADIIDIGGQSTRPGAEDVGAEEECRRILPAIEKIRKGGITVPISVDTYRASIARKALEAGANIINDISAGEYDKEILSVAAEKGVPIVLMHTRGTPQTMNSLSKYEDVVDEIGEELENRVNEALAHGVRRWQIILDPGLGFAKRLEQNVEVIRRLEELRNRECFRGLPWLLGPSRKRFIGKITGVAEPGRRSWGTAGAVAGCIAGGADIVRVHDVEEMSKVIAMADSIWRCKT